MSAVQRPRKKGVKRLNTPGYKKRANSIQTEAMVAGTAVASLLGKLIKGTSVPQGSLDSFELAKAELILDAVRKRYPAEEGWILNSEVTFTDHANRRKARPDIFAERDNAETGRKEIVVMEVKTTPRLEKSHDKSYKRLVTAARFVQRPANGAAKIRGSKYEDHQRQLIIYIRMLRQLKAETSDVTGFVVVCGGDTKDNKFLRWYGPDPAWLNSNEFIGWASTDTREMVAELSKHAVAPDVDDSEYACVINMPLLPDGCPAVCGVDNSGQVHGHFTFRRGTPYDSRAHEAIQSASPCFSNLIVLVP